MYMLYMVTYGPPGYAYSSASASGFAHRADAETKRERPPRRLLQPESIMGSIKPYKVVYYYNTRYCKAL